MGWNPDHSGSRTRLRLNDIQVLASHNSYHREPEPALLDALHSVIGDEADGFEYTHMPLTQEFDHGVRQVELDLFVDDPAGGRFATPKVQPLLGLDPIDPRMSEPGLKVFHVQEIDYRSTCPTFVSCLEEIRAWSDAHPNHIPITIQIEAKDDVIPDPVNLGFVTPIEWSSPAMAQMEQEIESVFPTEQIITPGDVMGGFHTLKGAVLHDRWPSLQRSRGRVMFTLDDTGRKRGLYRDLHPDIADRLVFVAAEPPDPDAAVVVVNDPIGDADHIRELVQRGFIVRTRADADTVQARSGDTTQRDAAWASGAHQVSTDYIVADPRFGTGYMVELPGGGPARCNPISAPPSCTSAQLTE
ncbi:MAG TPA: phosphatidylinositol-specific phospholipase C1-like protein [Acidimicrobiales bacterium]